MEAVAYVAGEPWTDHPKCASPVIGAFLRSWNDAMNDDDRQMLLPLIPRLVGTASTRDVEGRRAWMATDWLVRECAPAWLRLAGLNDHAHTLEQLAALTDASSARAAQPTIVEARKAGDAAWAAARAAARAAAWDAAMATAWDAAMAAAGDAAWAAAWAAAWDAAMTTAGDAAWAAAWAAAGDAAWDAAWAAARAAAWDAAWAAAWAALQPTVNALQVSALTLVDRMVEA
jgi:hypothetical protein